MLRLRNKCRKRFKAERNQLYPEYVQYVVCVIWVMTKQVKLTIKCNPSTPTRYMLNGEIVTGCTFVAQMLRDDLSGPCEIFFLVNDSSNHLSPAGTNVQEYEQ